MQDAARLWAFLAERSPAAARRFTARIATATDALTVTPHQGRPIDEGLRRLVVPFGAAGYVIHYRVGREEIVIARVWHARENRR